MSTDCLDEGYDVVVLQYVLHFSLQLICLETFMSKTFDVILNTVVNRIIMILYVFSLALNYNSIFHCLACLTTVKILRNVFSYQFGIEKELAGMLMDS